ncbi:cyclin-dependent kinase 2-interacting protein-like [Acipenser oxyrinchus oxyrinchus]|uniref:Cyclin-dependent kinase 2-interacting protein-like n=1 Tax=Acipenser oxyrinchus oxyrinchus TaxID=40147 RepID=A0AAD8FWL5_ACIOX|nr:cyclin-dependent kinase 2-interacting protein-like [Acipenser oxyrinchus oxyrinchus]
MSHCFTARSPGVASSARKPVLSNSARKIKDNAADWHNFILKWDKLNDTGFTVANNIVNIKISKETENDANLQVDCDGSSVTQKSACASEPHKELEECCTELLDIMDKMTHLVSKMAKLSSTVKGICVLESFQHGETGRDQPLFHTWPTKQFDEVSSKLADAYQQELRLKQAIVQEVAHSTEQDLAMVYLSAWLYQPYIEDSSRVLLESMLLETGHRPL